MSTFISYSRVNSPFVLRLAKDLKNAGFDVFLDQMDIPKGARWDDEIEAAVERSSIFMIVLAPESIESQNVKDELSYAIDAGKHILPVVIQPCKIPLRLRRFQYVNFTDKPYKESLSEIKHLLSNTQQIPQAAVEKPFYEKEDAVPLVKGPLIQRDPPKVPEPHQEYKPADDNRYRKFVVPALLAVIAVAAIAAVVVYAGRDKAVPTEILPISTNTQASPTASSTSTLAPPPSQITDLSGVTMRLVSAGDFIMGSDENGLADEIPAQTTYLDAFYIDKYEVTNALYRTCVAAGACRAPGRVNSVTHVAYYSRPEFDNFPIVYVDWNMARSFCEWRGARLPTEAEWEKAARGTDGRTFPWGEEISCSQANYSGCQGDTAAVFDFGNGLSPYGVHNMAGNVYEWVSSLYVPYPYDAMDGREDPAVTGDRVIRGGSWLKSNSEREVRSSRRQRADPSTATENIGFRCARSLDYFLPDTGLAAETPRNSFTATSLAATSRVRKTKEAIQGSASTSVPSSAPTFVEALVGLRPTVTPTEASVTINELPTLEPPTVEPPTPEPPTAEPPTSEPPPPDPPTQEPEPDPVQPPPATDPPTQ